MNKKRKQILSLFRYGLADHEAMANTYPHVLLKLSETLDVHHFSFKSLHKHWLTEHEYIYIHEMPIRLKRSSAFDKWSKTILWYITAPWIGLWARAKKIDLIYIEESLPILPLILMFFSGRPVAISSCDILWDVYLGHKKWEKPIRQFFEKMDVFTWKRLQGTITHTEAYKQYAVSKGIKADNIAVISEACESHIFYPIDKQSAREQFGFHDHDFVIVHHGILHPNKALDRIFSFVQPLLDQHKSILFVIAGDGPLRLKLEIQAKKLDMEKHVQFLGWLPHVNALNDLLNAGDVSLVMREGKFSDHFQVTANLLHSLACGSSILAARLKGISEWVKDGKNGLLFDPTDRDEFCNQLIRMLDHPENRKQMGIEAYKTVQEKLDPKKITQQWAHALYSFFPVEK